MYVEIKYKWENTIGMKRKKSNLRLTADIKNQYILNALEID
jgi:hypothetical protein